MSLGLGRLTPLLAGCCALLLLLLAGSAHAVALVATASRQLVIEPVDDARLIQLAGNIRPETRTGTDLGPVADDLVLEHVQLQLQRAPEDERSVARFVDALHDPASPQYQHWLSPAAFGARFGLAQADIDRVTAWLGADGLRVNLVYPSRMVIDFSGTAGQVAAAFHTTIHRLRVNGVEHIANMTDPFIPAALAPAVAGIVSLHNFRPQHRHRARPRYTAGEARLVAPADLATIYNFTPAFAAGITGIYQTIAVVEDSELYSTADWTEFRSTFGLAKYTAGSLFPVHPAPSNGKSCTGPGVNEDDYEAAIDAEWASAAAPSAQIIVASCANTQATSGIYLAIQNLVNAGRLPQTISVSYGTCEAENGATQNKAFATLYQQAAAEGISVFVATGDNGPSDCANDGQNGATQGIGVNGWASTQYNVAVGGTDFADTDLEATAGYWGKSGGAPWGTAKSYIPEIPWNDTCASSLLAKADGFTVSYGTRGYCNSVQGSEYLSLAAGEGGPSGCASGAPWLTGVVSGTCKGTPKPGWQAGVAGIPADGVRDVPDVSLFAGDGVWNHSYILCFSDPDNGGTPCTGNPGNWAGGGGTSYAAPIWAGIQALVNQRTGKAQGNPNYAFYQLAGRQYGAAGSAACNSSRGSASAASCVFHDVTLGDDDIDCVSSYNCYRPSGQYGVLSTSDWADQPAYKAGVGYDLPTGIGTVNVFNLIKSWPATAVPAK
jgi:subtilase family serine protease